MQLLLRKALAHPTIFGAYTELFAALSPEVTLEKSGWWSKDPINLLLLSPIAHWLFLVIPWGRFGSIRKDLEKAAKSHEEGSTGIAEQFWNWCEEQVKPYC